MMFVLLLHITVFVFFFQAEDGIRDRDVTGVQTCALPISAARAGRADIAFTTQSLLKGTEPLESANIAVLAYGHRSEERRVGKEWRSRGAPEQQKKERKVW